MDIKRLPLVAAVFCLLVTFTKGAEESAAPTSTANQLTSTKPEKDIHGPLLEALLAPVDKDINADATTLQRDKRHHKQWSDGGCTSNCGGGNQPTIGLVIIPYTDQKRGGYRKRHHGGGGGRCQYGGCGGGGQVYQQPTGDGCGYGGCGQVYQQPTGDGCGYGGCGQVYQQPAGGCSGTGCGGGSSSGSYSQSSASSSSGSWGKK